MLILLAPFVEDGQHDRQHNAQADQNDDQDLQGIGNRVVAYDLDQVGRRVSLSTVHVGVVVHLLLRSNAFTADSGVVRWTTDGTGKDGRP